MLRDEGINISRPTLYNLERKGFFVTSKTSPGGWRIYSPNEASAIVQAIKEAYRLTTDENIEDILARMAESAKKLKEIQPTAVEDGDQNANKETPTS